MVHGGRFVDAAWLRKWADSVEEVPVDTTPLICPHGKMDPDKFKGVFPSTLTQSTLRLLVW